jgi:hypothetical protein
LIGREFLGPGRGCPSLEWRDVILNGAVWHIEEAPADYQAQNKEEQEVLTMLEPEFRDIKVPDSMTQTK